MAAHLDVERALDEATLQRSTMCRDAGGAGDGGRDRYGKASAPGSDRSTQTIERAKKRTMAPPVYGKERMALLFIDPYNDFLSEGGKLWRQVEGVARKVGLLKNLRTITSEMRRRGFACSSRRIGVGSPATSRPGVIRRDTSWAQPRGRCSPPAPGEVGERTLPLLYSDDRMYTAHELNGPTYAHAIMTTAELLGAHQRDT